MRLLVFSDIHNNLACVRKLRDAEMNRFDAIVTAGDIGSKTADRFFAIMETFGCPVYYVYGNWDSRLGYDRQFAPHAIHLHHQVIQQGDFYFAGFSGCRMGWGRNPIAARLREEVEQAYPPVLQRRRPAEALRYQKALRQVSREAQRQNRQTLEDVIRRSGANVKRLILVTHERLYRLEESIGSPLLHIFGHQHTPRHTVHKGVHYLNASVLDFPAGVYPVEVFNACGGAADRVPARHRHDANLGNYFVVEIGRSDMRVEQIDLPLDGRKYVIAVDLSEPGSCRRRFGQLIPEEQKYLRVIDSRLK